MQTNAKDGSPSLQPLQVGLTRDFLDRSDNPWGLGIDWLRHEPGGGCAWFDRHEPEVAPEQTAMFDAVISLTPRWTSHSVSAAERLLLIARWGTGYDNVDLNACTRAGVLVTNTPEAVRRPVASANVTMIFALSNGLLLRDRDVREGVWRNRVGFGLAGKKIGSIGFGGIAKETFRLLQSLRSGFPSDFLAYSPSGYRLHQTDADELGIRLTDLPTILSESDYLMINCPLNRETHHLLDEAKLNSMKFSSCLINMARGSIVDEAALLRALESGRLAGAGLDVFEQEPLPPAHPLIAMPQVILSSHSLAYTHDLMAGIAAAHRSMIRSLKMGKLPMNIVNREAIDTPVFRHKLHALQERLRRHHFSFDKERVERDDFRHEN